MSGNSSSQGSSQGSASSSLRHSDNHIVIPKSKGQRESPISSYLNGGLISPGSVSSSATDRNRRASMAKLVGSPVSTTPISSSFQDGRGRSLLRSSFVLNSRPGSFATNNRPVLPITSKQDSESIFDSDQSSQISFGINNEDPNVMKVLNRHLINSEDPLQLQGGDITRDLYRLDSPSKVMGRRRSVSSTNVDHIRKYSMASSINVPGGFRREFIVRKTIQDQQKYGYKLSEPTFLTKNFIEFLSIYGHFAGEDLEDEDYMACDLINPLAERSDEETPLLAAGGHRRPRGTASVLKSFLILLKGFVGTGILFLPKAFFNGGLLFSILTLLFFGILSYWCYLSLVQSKIAAKVVSFGDIGYKLYGTWMRELILFSIVLSQIGFVAAYMVFTSENLHAFVKNIFNVDIPLNILVCLEILIFIPLSMIRNITKLSLAALLANAFILFGLCVIIYYTSLELISEGIGPNIVLFNKNSFSLFIGVAIFAFEGIGLIIPVQESMLNPEKFPLVLLLVITCCSTLFILVGTLCYSTFGDQVQTVIILNLPQTSIMVNSVQFFYALLILLSAPLQLFPAIKIIENKVFEKSGKFDFLTKWKKNSLRALMVVLTGITAYYGSDNLDKFVSFVGCFACIPLVYMYPPMLHYKSVAKDNQFLKISDILLIILGGVAMCYTSYQIIFG